MNRRAAFLIVAPIVLCCAASILLSAVGGTLTPTEKNVFLALLLPALALMMLRLRDITRELRELRRQEGSRLDDR